MKLFKKLYFKLYHLLKLLGIFIIIAPVMVKADCIGKGESGFGEITGPTGASWYAMITTSLSSIELEANKVYTVYVTGETKFPRNITLTCGNTSVTWRWQDQGIQITPGATCNLTELRLSQQNASNILEQLQNQKIIVVEGTEICTPTPPTPPDPPTPSGNFTYTDFVTLYVDRLKYLGNKSVENPYMLTFISIIIGFIVLEIFLRLYGIRGGYKK